MTNKLLAKAQKQHEQGKLEEALETYRQLLEEDSDQPDVLHLAAILLAKMGRYDESLRYLNSAIQLDPETAVFHNSKGNLLLRIGQFVEATKAYYAAIALKRDYAAAYNNLGNSFYRQRQHDNAINAYKKAIALDPNFSNAHFNYGRLLAEQGDLSKAIAELETTLMLDPNHISALGQLGYLYLHKKNYAKAARYFKKRLVLYPNDPNTLNDLGTALLKRKQWLAASECLVKAVTLQSNHPIAHYHLATAYLELGDHKQALAHYLKQIEITPHLESYYNIGVILMYQEHRQDAIGYFQKALELDAEYIDAHINIASTYLKLNQTENAMAHYEKALELKPNDSEILHILAALSQKESPLNAPREYVQHLFDHYARYYDQHLKSHLKYAVPEQLLHAIEIDANVDCPSWKILDLGCGTGLCGELFKPLSKELIGVDLSEKMLAIAKEKNIYDQLIQSDIIEALKKIKDIDLVLAADVFTYLGDLDNIFLHAKAALKNKGIFAFTVEKTSTTPYVLQKTIRYAHSRPYLDALIQKHGFTVLRFDSIVLRQQQRKALEGYLIVLGSVQE